VREGRIRVVILSRIGNQAIDIPRASVLIQLSGSYGSRQEEAQRLGRILRPKADISATFYTLVTTKTREVDDAWQRQQFLLGQGYRYQHISAEEIRE
jgi:DNA excision repair protein ERCC-3